MKILNFLRRLPWHVLVNILLAYVCYGACRLAFLLENWSFYADGLTCASLLRMWRGGLLFDTAAICFTNALYVLMALWPYSRFKKEKCRRFERPFCQATKWVFVVPNVLAVVINLMDSVYFSFTQQRVTANVFSEFHNEENLAGIVGMELLNHWYLVLLALLLTVLLWRGYRHPSSWLLNLPLGSYRLVQTAFLVFSATLFVCGMRGAFFRKATRPITMNDAFRYANQPIETALVLNTPFSIIKTLKHKAIETPRYFSTETELDKIFSPLHYPDARKEKRQKNVVILIVESFAQEFIGSRNRGLDGGSYKGYTPFADSLLTQSLTWKETFCNSWTSIDAMPAVLASIPRMRDPFVLSAFSVNNINSLATELGGHWGYQTAFFHGAENESMGFHAFARSAGFQNYFGREEFYADSRFGGRAEFDGTWGIWDEPFLQFFRTKISEMREPFFASVFTLSSHHPFAIPEKYKDRFKDEGIHKLHKCIRYTDYALRRFFEAAAKEPWYKNTVFVLCADHASSKTTHAEYQTELGHFRIPILFFDPSGEMPRGCRQGVAQQIDIMPTLLSYLGYDRPFVAFGKDLLTTPETETWAMNYHQVAQFIQGPYVLQFDGREVTAVYNYVNDPLLRTNLKGKVAEAAQMENRLKAFVQSFFQRMKANDVRL